MGGSGSPVRPADQRRQNGVCFRFVNLNLLFGILDIQKGMSALGVRAKTSPWRDNEIKGEK